MFHVRLKNGYETWGFVFNHSLNFLAPNDVRIKASGEEDYPFQHGDFCLKTRIYKEKM